MLNAKALSFVSTLWISRRSVELAGSHSGTQPLETPPREVAAAMSGYEVSTTSIVSQPARAATKTTTSCENFPMPANT